VLQADPAMLVTTGLLVDTLSTAGCSGCLASPCTSTGSTALKIWTGHPTLIQGEIIELASRMFIDYSH